MTDEWTQTIVVSCFESETAYELYCEPEGAVQAVEPGDVLTITFTGDRRYQFEISRVEGGIVLCRLGDGGVAIEDKRGRSLSW